MKKVSIALLALLLLGINMNVTAQTFEDEGYKPSKVQNYIFRNNGKSKQIDSIRIDTILVGEFYRFQFKTVDNKSSLIYDAIGLPTGLAMDPKGELYGLTYDEGKFDVLLTIIDGKFQSSGIITLVVKGETVTDNREELISAISIFPNPFKNELTIDYALDARYLVSIKIFNKYGKIVRFLHEKEQNSGDYRLIWDGRNYAGEKLQDGWYFVQINYFNDKDIIVSEIRKLLKLTENYKSIW